MTDLHRIEDIIGLFILTVLIIHHYILAEKPEDVPVKAWEFTKIGMCLAVILAAISVFTHFVVLINQ